MMTVLVVVHVVICILLVVTVLLQFGKGAEMGAIMGGGASQAIFSSSAKGNFLTKLTTVLAIAFMLNSIVLTTMKSRDSKKSLFDGEAPVAAPLNSDETQAMNMNNSADVKTGTGVTEKPKAIDETTTGTGTSETK